MNTDVFFTIGKTHLVCQDYAFAVNEGHVALSDGCSSSLFTDIGARILCHLDATTGPYDSVGDTVLTVLECLNLPTSSMDATLLSARWFAHECVVRVAMTGDGVIVARRRDGTWFSVTREFTSGAPRYMSYDLEPERMARYIQEFGGFLKTTLTDTATYPTRMEHGLSGLPFDHAGAHDTEDAWLRPIPSEPLGPDLLVFSGAIVDLVLLFSDGIQSFHRPVPGSTVGASEPVPVPEIIEEMLAIKGYAGQFITRRAKRFLKDAATRGWVHDDDFSVAALYLGEIS